MQNPAPQLALTFRGPFVFAVEASSVNVYAPKCPDHHAAIFTVNNEYPICGCFRKGGDYVYTLSLAGIDTNLGPIAVPNNEDWILDAPSGSKVDTSKASFCINVPRPKTVYPISPAKTEVVKNDTAKGDIAQRATGMRFYYDSADLRKVQISLIAPKPDGDSYPLSIDNLPSLSVYADLDISYADPGADDAEHSDAMSCFDNTMQLLGLPWWLYYGQSDKGALARTGADCKSLPVFVGR
jgi:hypothetical protein